MRAIRRQVAGQPRGGYTVAQAAVVTGLSPTTINHYITRDLGALDVALSGEGQRSLTFEGLVALRIAHDYQRALAPCARVEVIRKALRSPRKRHVVLEGDGKLTVPVSLPRAMVVEGSRRLRSAIAMVTSDPGTLQGEPCFRGTRIPVHTVAEIAKSMGVEQAKSTYPKLSRAQIELACVYAEAHPRRGRPRRASAVLAKRRPKSSRTVSVTTD